MTDQRCGTCRWWGDPIHSHVRNYYSRPCQYVVPGPVPDALQMRYQHSQEGTNCPCYQRKERDEREEREATD